MMPAVQSIIEYKSEMKIIPFNHKEHRSIILEWLIEYKMDLKEADELPSTGFITKKDGVYYAAGFLRFLEASKIALIDGMIVNPKTSGKSRNLAINLVCSMLIETAKQIGITGLLAFSSSSAIIKRSMKYGFSMRPKRMIALDLGGLNG